MEGATAHVCALWDVNSSSLETIHGQCLYERWQSALSPRMGCACNKHRWAPAESAHAQQSWTLLLARLTFMARIHSLFCSNHAQRSLERDGVQSRAAVRRRKLGQKGSEADRKTRFQAGHSCTGSQSDSWEDGRMVGSFPVGSPSLLDFQCSSCMFPRELSTRPSTGAVPSPRGHHKPMGWADAGLVQSGSDGTLSGCPGYQKEWEMPLWLQGCCLSGQVSGLRW